MSKAVRIPNQAQGIADALVRFCVRAGVEYEFLPLSGKGHPTIRMEYGRQSRRMTFAATPSDKRRAAMNAVSQARRVCRDMGWEKPKKDKKMHNVRLNPQGQKQGIKGGAKPASGAAGPARVTKFPPIKVAGVIIPRVFDGWEPGAGKWHGWSDNDKAIVTLRNRRMVEAKEAGATDDEITATINEAGWDIAASSVTALISKTRKDMGLPPLYRVKTDEKARADIEPDVPTKIEEPVTEAADALVDELAQEIAAALSPVISKRMAVLKAKADKWDAIKDLVATA